MVKIRIVTDNQNEALEWAQRVVRMAGMYVDVSKVAQSYLKKGRRGQYLIYIDVETEGGENGT